jgi:hypothetical protein
MELVSLPPSTYSYFNRPLPLLSLLATNSIELLVSTYTTDIVAL